MNCSIDQCELRVKARSYCHRHLRRFYKYGNPLGQPEIKVKPICEIEDCQKIAIARNWCGMHYRRWFYYGDPLITKVNRLEKKLSTYKNVTAHGHPNASHKGVIQEHRLVMSQMIGRPLLPHENVHHINGDRKDNRPENLELWSTSQPKGQRVDDKVNYALEILEVYALQYLQKSFRRDVA